MTFVEYCLSLGGRKVQKYMKTKNKGIVILIKLLVATSITMVTMFVVNFFSMWLWREKFLPQSGNLFWVIFITALFAFIVFKKPKYIKIPEPKKDDEMARIRLAKIIELFGEPHETSISRIQASIPESLKWSSLMSPATWDDAKRLEQKKSKDGWRLPTTQELSHRPAQFRECWSSEKNISVRYGCESVRKITEKYHFYFVCEE